jgi:ATP-binding cassette subfamily B protein
VDEKEGSEVGRASRERGVAGRVQVARAAVSCSPGVSIGLLGWGLVNAAVPVLLLCSTGELVGSIRSALVSGSTVRDQNQLTLWLVTSGILFAIFMALGPVFDGLRATSRVRLTFALQDRIMRAVTAPIGIGHLETPETLQQISAAQGSLTNYYPADAPAALAAVLSGRLSGVLACAVLGVFRWWIGLGVLALWLAIRQPLQRILLDYISAFGGEASVMRRADYLLQTATRAAAAKEVRIFGLSKWLLGQFSEHWFRGMASSWLTLSKYRKTVGWLGVLVAATYGLGIWSISEAARRGSISVAGLAILLPMLMLASSVGTATMDDVQLEWVTSAFPNVRALEQRLNVYTDLTSGIRPIEESPIHEIRFDQVGFKYPGATDPVFDALSLRLIAGRSTAIVGANGVGKTTLVKLLCRLYDPTEGQILVDGVPLSELDPTEWQRNSAVVFQDFNRYPVSLADNISLGSPEHRDDLEGVVRVAERVGLNGLSATLSSGWNTRLASGSAEGVDLSGGQWQRVALARALFAVEHGARLLILDEPTAALDIRGEAQFYEQFLAITTGTTAVVISHRFSSVRRAQTICVLGAGGVIEEGTHEELILADGGYGRFFSLQAARFQISSREEDDAV